MDVFNKRNALIGFLTLEMLKRRRRTKLLRRRAPKIAVFSLVGLAALVGIVAVVLRRRNGDDIPAIAQDDEEIVGEYVTASAEPIPAA